MLYVTYANGLQMSAIWGACTLALDMFVAVVVVACVGTAREAGEEKQEIRKKLYKNN